MLEKVTFDVSEQRCATAFEQIEAALSALKRWLPEDQRNAHISMATQAADYAELVIFALKNANERLRAENERLLTENARLREALQQAIINVEEWGSYASPFFREKWDLAGDIAKLRAALGA